MSDDVEKGRVPGHTTFSLEITQIEFIEVKSL